MLDHVTGVFEHHCSDTFRVFDHHVQCAKTRVAAACVTSLLRERERAHLVKVFAKVFAAKVFGKVFGKVFAYIDI